MNYCQVLFKVFARCSNVESVKKIADNNSGILATAKQIGIVMQTLSNWQNKANQCKLVGTEQYDTQLMNVVEEIN